MSQKNLLWSVKTACEQIHRVNTNERLIEWNYMQLKFIAFECDAAAAGNAVRVGGFSDGNFFLSLDADLSWEMFLIMMRADWIA